MTETPLERAHRHLVAAADALAGVVESGADHELLSVITLCEGATRRVDRVTVDAVAVVERRGFFTDRGYKSTPAALMDLVGWEQFEARRRVVAAEQVGARTSLDGAVLPARLPATGDAFSEGRASVRHVEVVARVLGTRAAGRLTPQQWAGVERQLAAKTEEYSPTELHRWGSALVEMLDQDGEQPDDGPRPGSTSCSSPATGRAVVAGSRAGSTVVAGPADARRLPQWEEAACGGVRHLRTVRRHAGAPSGGCSSTRGLYSTSWTRPSKVRCSIISRATSG